MNPEKCGCHLGVLVGSLLTKVWKYRKWMLFRQWSPFFGSRIMAVIENYNIQLFCYVSFASLGIQAFKLCSRSRFWCFCFWFDAWKRQLVCREFFPCNAGLIWVVAANQIASHYFRALFDYVMMCAHNLWKMLTRHFSRKIWKWKEIKTNFISKIKMAVAGTCGWCFDVFFGSFEYY